MGKWLAMLFTGLLGVVLAALAVLMPIPDRAPSARPAARNTPEVNVVLIVIDTLRADRLHAERNGVPVMPKLAALAAQGREFTRAISPSSWTRPSMASLFTGQYVDTHQVYVGQSKRPDGSVFADAIPEQSTTLAEAMAQAGYDTFAYVTNGHLQSHGFPQGFPVEQFTYAEQAPAAQVTDAGLAHAEKADPGFFMFLHYIDPHAPYDPPAEYHDVFGPLPEGLTDSERKTLEPQNHIPYTLFVAREMLGKGMATHLAPLGMAGREAMRQLYDADCRYTDDEVARAIEGIRAKHPNTVFIVTSDHGEEFWEHEGMGHGLTLFQETLSVPLFVLGPGVPAETVEHPVETLSIYKTLAQRFKLKAPQTLEGQDLLAEIPVNVQAFSRTVGVDDEFHVDLQSVTLMEYKLILDLEKNEFNTYTLYDWGFDSLDNEPSMRTNLIERMSTHHKHVETTRSRGIAPVQAEVSAEQLRHQRELGYGEE